MKKQRFQVHGGYGHTNQLWVVWDSEKNIYIQSSRDRDEMYALAVALNSASSPASVPHTPSCGRRDPHEAPRECAVD